MYSRGWEYCRRVLKNIIIGKKKAKEIS